MQQAPTPRRWFRAAVLALVVAPFAASLSLAETIPPVPRDHFNDYANVVSATVERQLNERLAAFERANSSQVVVAIFPRMQSTSPVKDYTLRVANAWGVGQRNRDNGIVLFAFMEERQLYLQVGTGLELRIPDSRAQQIIDRHIVPRFRARDIDGGLRDGVDAILTSIRAELPASSVPAAAAQIPVEASTPPPPSPYSPPPAPMNPPSTTTIHFNGGIGAGVAGGVFGIIFIIAVVAIIAAAIRAIGGSNSNDYHSSTSRTPPRPFFGGGASRPHRSRLGGFGGRSSSRGSGSSSGRGGGFRGGGAGGKW